MKHSPFWSVGEHILVYESDKIGTYEFRVPIFRKNLKDSLIRNDMDSKQVRTVAEKIEYSLYLFDSYDHQSFKG